MSENNQDWQISIQAPQECGEGSTTRPRSPDRTVKAHESPGSKVCVGCNEVKAVDRFDGNRSKCKACRNADRVKKYQSDPDYRAKRLEARARYVRENKEKAKQSDAKSYIKRRDEILAQKAKYHALNYERAIKPYKQSYRSRPEIKSRYSSYMAEYSRKHYQANKGLYLAKFIKRREAKRSAVPLWADLNAIKSVYKRASMMRQSTGLDYEVDHIIPLQGENVCGLHVAENLRIILRSENRSKSNKLLQDIV